MQRTWNMNQGKVEHQDTKYPSIDAGRRLDVGILKHALDVTSVDFDYKIVNTDDVEAKSAKSAI